MPFWDHVNELAKRLKTVLYALVVSTIFFMVLPSDPSFLRNPFEFYDPLVALILRQIRAQVLPPNVRLIGYELTAPLQLYLVASLVLGFAVTIPVLSYQIYRFVDPALYPNERGAVYPFVLSFTTLFVIGITFGYLVLTPFMIWALFPFFTAVGAEQIVSIIDFYTMVFVATIMSGLIFTWPVFFVLLVRFGLLQTSIIRNNRKYVYAVMYIATAFVTPDGGPLADVILFLPMLVLTEAGVYVARRYETKEIAGEEATKGTRCKFCSKEVEPGKAFCDSCGKAQL